MLEEVMSNGKFHVGQKFKNSPKDDSPFFELIKISISNGLAYYRVRCIYDSELELVLHDEDMHLFSE